MRESGLRLFEISVRALMSTLGNRAVALDSPDACVTLPQLPAAIDADPHSIARTRSGAADSQRI